ncbi:MAG: bifunctional metallophosphatase/5'-nucleotidase [Myxococcales bacterium]|nr:bifunctional metallophosphatase/5'-nucleotidase [Myxococcales bacterium]
MARPLLVVLSLTLAALGCKQDAPPAPAPAPADAGPAKKVELTFLLTGAENGYLLATPDQGALHGGAAEVLGRWAADEGHCPGALGPNGESACPDGHTVVLSTGDNANGQAISSFYKGEPTAEVMRLMGYAGSAFGNRELDWAREQFLANTRRGGFPYLAANVIVKSEEGRALGLQPYRLLTRRGVTVAVVGLAARKATWTPMPGRMTGLEVVPDDVALGVAIPAAKKDGADVVVVVTDGCLHEVPEVLTAHPDWKPAFVAGRDCDVPYPEAVGDTRLVYPGRHFNSYAKVVVAVEGAQVTKVAASSVDVVAKEGAAAPEAKAKALLSGWKQKLDAALGEVIGFSKQGLDQQSPQMSAWLTTALKEQFKADVALLNRRGVRQALPAGPVTKATVWDLIPFENEVVVAQVKGDALLAALSNVEARAAGVKAKGDGWVDAKGAPLDPARTYSVATLDYLYLGGDGFKLLEADPKATQTKTSWQQALIEWTAAKKSDEKKPLEALLPR